MHDSGIDQQTASRISHVIDGMADRYDFEKKPTQLTVVGVIPEILKIYIASRSVENLSKGTLKLYYLTIKNFFAEIHKPYDQITTNDIRVYLFNYKEKRKVKDSSLKSIRATLNSFFQWLTEEDYIAKNPVIRIAPIKFNYESRQPLTEIELERMRSSCQTLREKALVDFMFSTGCRLSELTSMEITDVDFSQNEVMIRHGKGNKSRKSYLNAESVVSLRAYLASRKDDSPFLFTTVRNPHGKLGNKSVEIEVTKIANRSGINRKVSPHIFRHTAATTALKHGMQVEEVQRFLGHSKIDTTLIYAKVNNDSVKSSHQRCVS